jgi:hypothetical protein
MKPNFEFDQRKCVGLIVPLYEADLRGSLIDELMRDTVANLVQAIEDPLLA